MQPTREREVFPYKNPREAATRYASIRLQNNIMYAHLYAIVIIYLYRNNIRSNSSRALVAHVVVSPYVYYAIARNTSS